MERQANGNTFPSTRSAKSAPGAGFAAPQPIDWGNLAVAKYLDLKNSESTFVEKYVELLQAEKTKNPSFFKQVDWQMQLADRTATTLGVKLVVSLGCGPLEERSRVKGG